MAEIEEFRDFVQTLYRRLGFLQRDEVCCADVTVPQCYALQILLREGDIASGDLAGRLGLDPSSATRAVDVLVRRELVERVRPEGGDRRRVLLKLTRAGRKLTGELLEAGDRFYGRVLGSFTADERRDLLRLIGRLAEVLDATSSCCDPFGVAERSERRGAAAKRR